MAKAAPRKRIAKPAHLIITKRVGGNASIAEFADALRKNISENYEVLAEAVVSGSMPNMEAYRQATGALTAYKEVGAIIRATLLQEDEEEREDEADRKRQRRK